MSNVSLVSYNIALRKVGLNANLVQIDKIKGVVTDHTSETNLIVSQFPNMLVVAAPKKQVTVIIQTETVVINDSSTEISDERATILGAIAHGIDGVIQESLERYSYSFDFVFEFDSPKVAKGFTDYFNKPSLVGAKLLTNESNIVYASFALSEKIGDTLIRTAFNPKLDKDDDATTQVGVQRSAVIKSQSLKPISELSSEFLKHNTNCVQLQKDLQATTGE